MLGRVLVCAVVLGMASPACAGEETQPAATSERASYSYAPDALTLLLQDDRTTWGTPPPLNPLAPGFDMAGAITVTAVPPMAGDLASFDAIDAPVAAFAYLSASEEEPETLRLPAPVSFGVLPGLRLTPRLRAEPMGGPADAVNDSRAAIPRAKRRRDPLAMMLVFRLDGEESSPAFSFGGGVASVLNVLPRQ
jgi:hypothetical protein